MLPSYCSWRGSDSVFGSRGRWEDNEDWIEGGGANPSFQKGLVRRMTDNFDEGIRSPGPTVNLHLYLLAHLTESLLASRKLRRKVHCLYLFHLQVSLLNKSKYSFRRCTQKKPQTLSSRLESWCGATELTY